MHNEIKIFENADFGQIRTAGTSEEPLFCLSDICKALGLTVKGVVQRLDKGVISKYPLETAGGTQMAYFVNEDGLEWGENAVHPMNQRETQILLYADRFDTLVNMILPKYSKEAC